MELDQQIEKAIEWNYESSKLIVGLGIPATERDRISISLLHLSLEHCHALVPLIEQNILGSALALLRPQFEAYVNGVWIKWCASDKRIEDFKEGNIPKFQNRINSIGKIKGFDQKVLSKIKEDNWAIFCDFTHGGMHQVVLRNTKEGISYNFPPDYIANTMNASVAFSLSASVALAHLVNNNNLASDLYRLHQKIYEVKLDI